MCLIELYKNPDEPYFPEYKIDFDSNIYTNHIAEEIKQLKMKYDEINSYNTVLFIMTETPSPIEDYEANLVLFRGTGNTKIETNGKEYDQIQITDMSYLRVNNKECEGLVVINFPLKHYSEGQVPKAKATINYKNVGGTVDVLTQINKRYIARLWYSSISIEKLENFKGFYPCWGVAREFINYAKRFFNLVTFKNGIQGELPKYCGKPPTSDEETNNSSCNSTGQFGGGGTPLKDIKLFLYANNVTKGTIKLSKPQVEVGTFATDWRPNPSDYVKANSDAYKKIKSLAVQQGQSDAKKYMQIESTDGTLYGVDLWGGDVQKLLEQQQAEIEELKKMVQTLETKINV